MHWKAIKLHEITVEINNKETSIVSYIELFSHYTCLYGKDSAEGKTKFYSSIEDGLTQDTVEIKIIGDDSLKFTLATAGSLEAILDNKNRYVILMDESAMLKDSIISRINKSHHLFIGIGKSMPFKMDYPLVGLYKINNDLSVEPMESLPMCNSLETAASDVFFIFH